MAEALKRASIEVVPFEAWPGFEQACLSHAKEYEAQLVGQNHNLRSLDTAIEQGDDTVGQGDSVPQVDELQRKAAPEAEALVVILKERSGDYHVLSQPDVSSPAWFISNTSVLNRFGQGGQVTWQPEAFLRFATTLFPTADGDAADCAFEALVWSVAEAGLSVIDDAVAETVFRGVIDQSVIDSRRTADSLQGSVSGKIWRRA